MTSVSASRASPVLSDNLNDELLVPEETVAS